MFEKKYTLYARFDDISGLREGATVQLAGVNIGIIDTISFNEELGDKKVVLSLKVRKTYQDRIRADSQATVVTQGLLGDKMIYITVGTPQTQVLADGAEIATKVPVDFASMMKRGEEVMAKASKGIDQINDVVYEIKEGKGLLHALIYDPKVPATLDKIDALARNLEEASGHLQTILTKVDQGQGTLGALVNDASVYNDIKTLLGKANRNKLIKAVIRETLKTREKELIGTSVPLETSSKEYGK